jgi:hypothetical protein
VVKDQNFAWAWTWVISIETLQGDLSYDLIIPNRYAGDSCWDSDPILEWRRGDTVDLIPLTDK